MKYFDDYIKNLMGKKDDEKIDKDTIFIEDVLKKDLPYGEGRSLIDINGFNSNLINALIKFIMRIDEGAVGIQSVAGIVKYAYHEISLKHKTVLEEHFSTTQIVHIGIAYIQRRNGRFM